MLTSRPEASVAQKRETEGAERQQNGESGDKVRSDAGRGGGLKAIPDTTLARKS